MSESMNAFGWYLNPSFIRDVENIMWFKMWFYIWSLYKMKDNVWKNQCLIA